MLFVVLDWDIERPHRPIGISGITPSWLQSAALLEYVLHSFILTKLVDTFCLPDSAGFELLNHQAAPKAIAFRSPAARRFALAVVMEIRGAKVRCHMSVPAMAMIAFVTVLP